MDHVPHRRTVSFVRPITRLKIDKRRAFFTGTYKISKLAANVPDLVVYEGVDRPIPDVEHFHGVLLFADISGFTSLTETYTRNSKKGSGADHLTRTLNGYISDIVDHILQAGGDIVNYAGDALLALWRESRKALSQILTLAVKCSLNIQDKCDNRETEVGVKLRVKIGISAGKLSKVVMGDEESRYYALIGRAIDEVRKAEGLASANTVILSPNAWELCDRSNLVVEKIENERAVRVRYIKRDPQFSVEKYVNKHGTHLEFQEVGVSKEVIRKTARLLPNPQLEAVLRKYLLKTVLLKIDAAVPLEYLSEMRPATVVFVNLQLVENATMNHQCQSIQACCTRINNEFRNYQGRINKVFMFDKGCTFLCVFGLPGDKGEDECGNALQCAHNVSEFCDKLRYVSVASIGVASGPLFCGVVGHPLRHEYTVIGRKVNLAARLMMTYPGVVSCDEETHYHAKLPSSYFIELPKQAMKGVANPGTVYQYLSKKHQKILGKPRISVEKDDDYPLLGREKEMKIFHKALKIFISTKDKESLDCCQVIMYEGTVGCGKSRLLVEIIRTSQAQEIRVLPFELGKMDITEPYYTIQTMMALLLHVNHCKSYAERERVLLSKITKPELIEDLCLLNDLLFVKFPTSERVSLMDSRTKHRAFRNYVIAVIKQNVTNDTVLLVIDQVQYIDTQSWELILQMRAGLPLFMVMALRPFTVEKPPCQAAVMVMRSKKTSYVKLSGLDPTIIHPLACQILGVISIPRELEILLMERSYGVPYYCEEILRSLYNSDLIILEPLEEEEEDESDAVLTYTRKKRFLPRDSSSFQSHESSQRKGKKSKLKTSGMEIQKCRKVTALEHNAKYDHQQFICMLGEMVNLQEITIPLTLKGIALAQLDRMNTTEQVVVKCASIIGHTFTTKMLRYILPEGAEQKLNQSLISLVKSRTLECASRINSSFGAPMEKSEETHLVQCFCNRVKESEDQLEEDDEIDLREKAAVWSCKVMRFCIALVHETANDLWLKEQKKSLHLKCTRFLENAARKCSSCGGGDFIYEHRSMVNFSVAESESTVQRRRELYTTISYGNIRSFSPEKVSDQDFPSKNMNSSIVSIHHGDTSINPSSTNISKSFDQALTITSTEVPAGSGDSEFIERIDNLIKDCEGKESLYANNCDCNLILESVYCPLVRHWMGTGNVAKTFFYLLETSAAALHVSNNLMALSYITQAENMLSLLHKGKPPFEYADTTKNVKMCSFERACVYILKGEVQFKTGHMDEAENLFKKGLMLLNKNFPNFCMAQIITCAVEKYKYSKRPRDRDMLSDVTNDDTSPVVYQQIHCLSYLWQTFCLKKNFHCKLPALLTILMEMNCAEDSKSEFQIINAYIDAFRCYQLLGLREKSTKMQIVVLRKCLSLDKNQDGVLTIGRLVCAVSEIKLCVGQLAESIEYGRQAHKIAGILNKPNLDVFIIPILAKAFLFTGRLTEYVDLMTYMNGSSTSAYNILGQATYYAACLDFALQEGFALRPFEECLSFVNGVIDDPIMKSEKNLLLSLHSSVALWFFRLSQWKKAIPSFKISKRLMTHTDASLFSMYGYAKFLECQILVFRKALWEKQETVMEVYQQTKEYLHEFRRRCNTTPVFYARFLHLKAYCLILAGQVGQANQLLEHALEISNTHGNVLEERWIKTNQGAWFAEEEDQEQENLWLAVAENMPTWEEGGDVTQSSSHSHRQASNSRPGCLQASSGLSDIGLLTSPEDSQTQGFNHQASHSGLTDFNL
ncbi:adenylate cyclase type 10-like [Mobula hypostoma]|uniref:adenylate cyclase type 10-like n=1 Tax=Mobula hypostoma TaxID=723540 RepID=UPI002FC2BEFE